MENLTRRPARRTAVALGYFDGVHLGHRRVLAAAAAAAAEKGLDSGVFTFVFGGENPIKGDAILSAADAGVPILGICLGMQMLFQHSEENGFYDGLGLFPGTITKFRDAGLKIPHMGWNTLDTRPCVLFDGGQSPFVYFVHSYCMADVSPEWTTATCTYGQTFTAAIQRGNVMATQFHPEKSGEVGLNMLRRFAQWKGDKSC